MHSTWPVKLISSFRIVIDGRTNLGIPGKLRPIHELSPHDFKEVLAVNAESVWLCEREEISQMLKQTPGSTQCAFPMRSEIPRSS